MIILPLLMGATLVCPSLSLADTVLEFLIRNSPASAAATQAVAIKDGKIMVKAAGGDRNLDFLYSSAEERVVMVDHGQRTVMTIDEVQVDRLNRQLQGVQPLLQGLGEKIAHLSPEQRRNWQELLGDSVSLDEIAKSTEPPESTRLASIGGGRVAGINCQTMRVIQGKTPMAELCLASPAAVKIPKNDYAAIRALLGLYERLAAKSKRVAGQFGLVIPSLDLRTVTGIPIKLRDLSRAGQGSITLLRIKNTPVPAERMSIPSGYAAKPLEPW